MKKIAAIGASFFILIASFPPPSLFAAQNPQTHPEVKVTAAKPDKSAAFLPEYSGTQIYSGKKTTSHDLNKVAAVQADNYRRVFSQIPGLLVSELSVPSIVNFSYRGLNDPHESNGLLVMQDGIPVMSDWHGYPTLYYSPPLESIERVEFIRGGSSLLYGPQPGPVINYITHQPPKEKAAVETKHTFGSNGLYSTYNSLGGTVGPLGYYGYYHHRQADGPRENSDYSVHSESFKAVSTISDSARVTADFNGYNSQSGEAGRLTFDQYSEDPNRTTRFDDRLWVDRFTGSLNYEQELGDDVLVNVKPWVGHLDRFSRRQANATGQTTNLDRQEFTFVGVDNRFRWLYDLFQEQHAFTGGFLFYYADAPRKRELGAFRNANDGTDVFEMDRSTQYWSIFFENLFKLWRLSIVPAFRIEMIKLNAQENYNTSVTRPLIDEGFFSAVPLFGLGVAFDLGKMNELYFNVSQGYQPKEYDDIANPTSNTFRAPSDLDESMTWNYEVGVRGNPIKWFTYDTSLFFIDYDNYIENQNLGGGNFQRSNSGRAQLGGWEAMLEADMIGLWDQIRRTDTGATYGEFGPFANLQLLQAKFVSGINDGRDPSYAPEYLFKWGLNYRLRKLLHLSLSTAAVADHYWQDSNAAGTVGTTKVGEYKVWDFSVESHIYKDIVSIFGGVNNLFGESYYSRIRSDGIEPAEGRNFFGGFKFRFGIG